MIKTKAVLFTGANAVAVEEVEIPDPGRGEVLIETLCTCVSPGTELRCLSGKQGGMSPYPFIPGYANVGRIVGGGPGVDIAEGALVLHGGTQKANRGITWGAHVGMAVRQAHDVIPLDAGTDPVAASVSRLAAIAYHGVRLSNPRPDERVAVVGLGPIGMFSALLHALTGARVAGFDLYPERVALARSLGLEAHETGGGLVATAKGVFPEGADVVVDSTGSAAVLLESSKLGRTPPWGVVLRDLPRLVIQGSYPAAISLDYHEVFYREYSILVPRDRTDFDSRVALDLIARGRLEATRLVTAVKPPDEAPAVYRGLRERPREFMTVVFDWRAP
jgi:2-desacetyl-2-hydroxyethyl bacteriochlorophyllide A dehydrogenase